jgi:glyceraldehyde-3-phosphate dehydrogenase (NADP+)
LQEVRSPVIIRDGESESQEIIGSYPLLSVQAAMDMVESAVHAYDKGKGPWPTMSVENRIEHVQKFSLLMKQKREEVVNLLMWEIGKTRKDSEKEFDRTIEYIDDTIDALKDVDRVGSRFMIEDGVIAQIRRAPLGVVLCMGPFNYPLNETFTTLIPALIMGNTILFKPAKYGVLLLRPLLEAFRDAFPKGVVNTLYGSGKTVIGPVMAGGKVDVLAFIGSASTANVIEKQHPRLNRLKTVYGLNAKNPAIILRDADIALTVKECILGTLSYNGQRCTALKILFVHESIAEEFIKAYVDAVGKLKIGMPWDDGVAITPLPEENKTQWLTELVDDARRNGASIVNPSGGEVQGTLMIPAVLYPVSPSMRLYNEEQFGPVVPIVPFRSIDEPVQYMTESSFGQQVSIFSTDAGSIAHLVDPLVNQVCRVNINCQCQRGPDVYPFTGRKDSAAGTLSVSDALRVFSIRTLVATKEDGAGNRELITDIIRNRRSNFLSTDFIL